MHKFYISLATCVLLTLGSFAQTNLIPFGSAWKYLDNGSNQGTAWKGISFSDGTWKTGNGKFGYGSDTSVVTKISYGSNATNKYITTYFRKKLTITTDSAYSYYIASIKRDDGVVVYVNGLEVFRNNLPTGTISYTTKASNATDNGTAIQTFNIKASAFVSGTNVIAVEVHQTSVTSSDIIFDLALVGNSDFTKPTVTSINRQSPTTTSTSATSVTHRVTFSERVSGVDTADFLATKVSGTVGGVISSVVAVGTTGTIYDVKTSSITGDGILRLDLKSDSTGIIDQGSNAISGGYTQGQPYTIMIPPSVVSINRQSPATSTTSATSVTYRVTFSEKVSGVDAADFAVTRVSGTVTGTVASNGVVAVDTTGKIYDVTVSSITGTGDLRLDLKSTGTGITDSSGNAISGGYTSGQIYTFPATDLPPNAPANTSPAIGAYSSPSSTTLCATVSDSNNNLLRVRFYGRKKPNNGKFTIIMVPDTQFYTSLKNGGTTSMFDAQTNWIAKNRAAKNIVYVGQLGDCVDHGDQYEVEWIRANSAMEKIEDPSVTGLSQGIPYGVCVGNHDQTPNGDDDGSTKYYNKYFGASRFSGRSYYGGHRGTSNDNHYQLFSASGIDFLVIALEYDASSGFSASGGALDWAESIVKANPNRKVIVMTHFALTVAGAFSTQGSSIYNRLKVYPNFFLLTGAHDNDGDGESRRSDSYNGRTIHTILSNYQSRAYGGNGLMRIYEFDPSTNVIAAQTYSPYRNTYETDSDSKFNLTSNFSSSAQFALIGEVSNVASGSRPCKSWPSLQTNSDYEWYVEVFDGKSTTKGPIWSFTTKAPIVRN